MTNRTCLVLLAALAIMLPHTAAAQATSYEIIHTFKGDPDGADPEASVVIGQDGALYGTTYLGGTYKSGTVFQLQKVTGQPWEETVLHSFGPPPVEGATSDGSYPRANLVFGKEGALYGTTATGPTNAGTIFRLTAPSIAGSAWTETVLYTFDLGAGSFGPDGAVLIGPAGTLYTTTAAYLIPGGTVVAVVAPRTPGGTWTGSVIYSFIQPGGVGGSTPLAGMVSENGALYGTNFYEGAGNCVYGCGVVYELTAPATPGGAWTEATIHNFGVSPGDGSNPVAALTVGAGGVLYGTTQSGGLQACATSGLHGLGCGTVFQLTPPTTLGGVWTESAIYSFTGADGDGAAPVSSIVLGSNGALYGTTQYGGTAASDLSCPASYYVIAGCGIVFQLTPPTTPGSPWTEKVLHSFTGQNGDGAIPVAGLALSSSGVLYGTTSAGGAGAGVVFSIKP